MTTRNNFNVIVLEHVNRDITINDLRVIDAFATDTTETAMELTDRLAGESYDKYGKLVLVYIQPY